MRQLISPSHRDHPDPASLEALAEVYAYPDQVNSGRPWLRANMVAGLDGAAWLAGLSEGLSSEADKRIFGVLRALCDVVLVGAGTVRAEGYRPARARPQFAAARQAAGQAPAPVIAVVSRSLELDPGAPLFTEPLVRTVVITTEDAPAEARRALAGRADLITAGRGEVDLPRALAALTERGWTRQLTEGGPRLLADLAAAGLLDELCLSLAPLLTGGDAPRIMHGVQMADAQRMSLVSLIEQKGFLFTRYCRTAQ